MRLEHLIVVLMLVYQVFRAIGYVMRLRDVHAKRQKSPLGYEDASNLNLVQPEKLVPLIRELEKSGFIRLVEVRTTGAAYNPPLQAWVLVDREYRTKCD